MAESVLLDLMLRDFPVSVAVRHDAPWPLASLTPQLMLFIGQAYPVGEPHGEPQVAHRCIDLVELLQQAWMHTPTATV